MTTVYTSLGECSRLKGEGEASTGGLVGEGVHELVGGVVLEEVDHWLKGAIHSEGGGVRYLEGGEIGPHGYLTIAQRERTRSTRACRSVRSERWIGRGRREGLTEKRR